MTRIPQPRKQRERGDMHGLVVYCTACNKPCEHTSHHMSMTTAWRSRCCGAAITFKERDGSEPHYGVPDKRLGGP